MGSIDICDNAASFLDQKKVQHESKCHSPSNQVPNLFNSGNKTLQAGPKSHRS